MECIKCNAIMKDNAKYCGYCGTKMRSRGENESLLPERARIRDMKDNNYVKVENTMSPRKIKSTFNEKREEVKLNDVNKAAEDREDTYTGFTSAGDL